MKSVRILQYSIRHCLMASLLCISSMTYADTDQALPLISVAGIEHEIVFEDYHGKTILIDFWASWCGPCRQSFPWMNALHTQYQDQGLVVIAINLDSDKADADEFLNDVPANFLLGFDPEGLSAEKMNVEAMPMSYLVDTHGNIRHRMMGFNTMKKAEHEAHILELLNEAKSLL